ncbi:thiol-disulfide oxidoreductase DCC family protein [Allostreptomyces psammosilenae]|uniref:Putative DCC family thiol-disulfide oxidoreductase YuxK n=1 Tax=Allostreptomyces psammosilenae TaxID=1892865 RepID=A0A852ZT73_9ACTN|nr:DUF393 domain-containing protein [Allostreptomyces psammosilenae]NYI05035.1 putative DCC family thiol-disulfide oxidoreductase YuxK [Allostreptomyces psammosilenae]
MRSRPVLVYDGDCGFCTRAARFAEARVRPDAEITPWQFTDLAALDAGRGLVTEERARHEVLWVATDGRVYGGAQAVARALLAGRAARRAWAVPGALLTLPPIRWAAAGVYRLIAVNRHRMPGGTAACALPPRA